MVIRHESRPRCTERDKWKGGQVLVLVAATGQEVMKKKTNIINGDADPVLAVA